MPSRSASRGALMTTPSPSSSFHHWSKWPRTSAPSFLCVSCFSSFRSSGSAWRQTGLSARSRSDASRATQLAFEMTLRVAASGAQPYFDSSCRSTVAQAERAFACSRTVSARPDSVARASLCGASPRRYGCKSLGKSQKARSSCALSSSPLPPLVALATLLHQKTSMSRSMFSSISSCLSSTSTCMTDSSSSVISSCHSALSRSMASALTARVSFASELSTLFASSMDLSRFTRQIVSTARSTRHCLARATASCSRPAYFRPLSRAYSQAWTSAMTRTVAGARPSSSSTMAWISLLSPTSSPSCSCRSVTSSSTVSSDCFRDSRSGMWLPARVRMVCSGTRWQAACSAGCSRFSSSTAASLRLGGTTFTSRTLASSHSRPAMSMRQDSFFCTASRSMTSEASALGKGPPGVVSLPARARIFCTSTAAARPSAELCGQSLHSASGSQSWYQ
mmetsp:Transcript_8628/g.25326  ORF Transcript_8628/g.25326 Transcript_8628/m.25326 type:complete len:450 (+) Transcript_8628:124-1473(+)